MRMLKDMSPEVLKRLYDKSIRFSSAELPMGFMDKAGPLQPVLSVCVWRERVCSCVLVCVNVVCVCVCVCVIYLHTYRCWSRS